MTQIAVARLLVPPRGLPDPEAALHLPHRRPSRRGSTGDPGVQRTRAFYRISLLGTTEGAPAEVGRRALAEFATALRFRRAEIWLLGRDRRLRRLSAYGTTAPSFRDPVGTPLRACPFGRSLVRRRQGLLHAGARGGSRRRVCHLRWLGMGALFGAPLRGSEGPVGLLFADRGGRPFEMTAADLEAATALAGLMAEVLKGALGREAEARRREGLLLLNQVGRAISAEENVSILLPRLASLVRRSTGVGGVVVALHDESAREFEVAAIAGPRSTYARGYRFPARASRAALSPRVLNTGRPLRIHDLRLHPDVCLYWPGSRSALVIPIRSKGAILGTFRLEDERLHAFDDEHVGLYSILAEQIGHALRRARVIEALNRKQADLRAVSESLERRLEEERRRIARELHDELAQSLTAARINLGILRRLTRRSAPEVRQAIRETEAVVLSTIEDTRRIAMDLRPAILDELGLVPALRWYVETFARRTGIRADLKAETPPDLPRGEIKTLLFRFFQEGLTNVARHARATTVRIGLHGANGILRAVVADDGIGFKPGAPSHQGLGLLGMRERIERAGGLLRIHSRPGCGTRLAAEIPLPVAGRPGRRQEAANGGGRSPGRGLR